MTSFQWLKYYNPKKSACKVFLLKNIKFINGYSSYAGAVYYSGQNINILNCTFENNVAYNNPGGAIYTYSNGVNNFINCTFIGNKMTKSGQYGGAVYISGDDCEFLGNQISDNYAYDMGGAIAIEGWEELDWELGIKEYNSSGDVVNIVKCYDDDGTNILSVS